MVAVGVGAWRAATPLALGPQNLGCVIKCIGDLAPGSPRLEIHWLRPDGGAAVGHSVLQAVALDLDDGSHPDPILRSVARSVAEGLGDVRRWVLDDPVRLLPQSFVEDIADRVEFNVLGSIGDEVTRTTVLARVEGGDLVVKSVGLLLEVAAGS